MAHLNMGEKCCLAFSNLSSIYLLMYSNKFLRIDGTNFSIVEPFEGDLKHQMPFDILKISDHKLVTFTPTGLNFFDLTPKSGSI